MSLKVFAIILSIVISSYIGLFFILYDVNSKYYIPVGGPGSSPFSKCIYNGPAHRYLNLPISRATIDCMYYPIRYFLITNESPADPPGAPWTIKTKSTQQVDSAEAATND